MCFFAQSQSLQFFQSAFIVQMFFECLMKYQGNIYFTLSVGVYDSFAKICYKGLFGWCTDVSKTFYINVGSNRWPTF